MSKPGAATTPFSNALLVYGFNGTVHLPPAVMGMFQVKVKVASPAHPEKYFEQTFWVHTGALYTFIPEDRLASIELKPLCARAD